MKISAVIAEYNPFHNGHKYMLERVKEASDAVAVIMSGSFVQRGGIAVTDKWSRANAALLNGADLVVELPVTFALNTAQKFAYGGVYLADAIGADELCFGSESGNTDELLNAADILAGEPIEVSRKIKAYIADGMSYPSARSRAYEGIIDADILRAPNNILATEYIGAARKIKSNISFRAIKRRAVGHDDMTVTADTASASAIRARLSRREDISAFVPENSNGISAPYDLSRLDSAIIYSLRNYTPTALADINDVSEGLENRIIKMSFESSGFDELCEKIKTKRYTRSRINRIVLSSYLGLTKELCAQNPSYVRVLGMNGTGIKILAGIKHTCPLEIITKAASYTADDAVFRADLRASEAFSLCAPDAEQRLGGADFKTSPVITKTQMSSRFQREL